MSRIAKGRFIALLIISRQRHVCCFRCVPTCMFRQSFKLDNFSQASLNNHTFFFTFVEQLLLSGCQRVSIGKVIHIEVFIEVHVFWSSVHSCVNFACMQSGVKGWPSWHEELFLVCTNIDNAIFVFHQMLEAWCCIKLRWDTHRCTHETIERHI